MTARGQFGRFHPAAGPAQQLSVHGPVQLPRADIAAGHLQAPSRLAEVAGVTDFHQERKVVAVYFCEYWLDSVSMSERIDE